MCQAMCMPLRLLTVTAHSPSTHSTCLLPQGGRGKARVKSPDPWRGADWAWLWHSHSCLGQGAFRHIPHSTGLGSSKWHLRWSSRECRCRTQSQIRSFSRKYPTQTCIHSCCPAQQQTPLPDQSSGYEVGQMSGWNNNIVFHLVISELSLGSVSGQWGCRPLVLSSWWELRALLDLPKRAQGVAILPWFLAQGAEITFASMRNLTQRCSQFSTTWRLNAQFVDDLCTLLLFQFLLPASLLATSLPN